MRIVVVGTSGSGKTTFAKRIAAALNVRRIEIDALNWLPGWVALNAINPGELERRVEAATPPRRGCPMATTPASATSSGRARRTSCGSIIRAMW